MNVYRGFIIVELFWVYLLWNYKLIIENLELKLIFILFVNNFVIIIIGVF